MLTEREAPAAVGYQLSARLIRSLPDLGLGLLFAAAWLNLFNLGARHGVGLMLLVEIEGWIIIVTFVSAAFAYALTKDTEWTERAKDVIGIVSFCAIPPVFFATRWHVWWPIPTYALLLWNRFRLARMGKEGARQLRMPVREMVTYAAAGLASLWLAIPVLGASAAEFRIADYPGWCHAPEILIPDNIRNLRKVVTWCDEPHRALAAGVFYYCVTGVITLLRGPHTLAMLGRGRRDE
ncbi:MAG TPA: hypothetical protein VKB63_01020 [Gemmatimonadales bacterium]|nr:hypothetical protein [Gemmatimonadales bacterium]